MIFNDINNQLTHSPEFLKTENECSSNSVDELQLSSVLAVGFFWVKLQII